MAIPNGAAIDAAVRRGLQPDTVAGAVGRIDRRDRATIAAGHAEEATAAVIGIGRAEGGAAIVVGHAETGIAAPRAATRAVHRCAGSIARLIQEQAGGSAIAHVDCAPADAVDAVGFDTVVAASGDGGAPNLKVGTGAASAVIDTVGDARGAIDPVEGHGLAGAEVHPEKRVTRHVEVGDAHIARIGGANNSARAGTRGSGAVARHRDVALDRDLTVERPGIPKVQRAGTHIGDAGICCRGHIGTGVAGDTVDSAGPGAARKGDFANRGERGGGGGS